MKYNEKEMLAKEADQEQAAINALPQRIQDLKNEAENNGDFFFVDESNANAGSMHRPTMLYICLNFLTIVKKQTCYTQLLRVKY